RNPAPGSGPALAWSAGLDRGQPSRMSRGTGTSGSRTCSWQSSTGWPKMPSALGVQAQAQSRSGARARRFGPVEQPDGDRLEQDLARAPRDVVERGGAREALFGVGADLLDARQMGQVDLGEERLGMGARRA